MRWLAEQLSIGELLDVLSGARCVVGPSTGVLHLAASLDTPVVGLYSPRKVEHPRRWGPKGPRVSILVPDVPADTTDSTVMNQIEVDQVLTAIHQAVR